MADFTIPGKTLSIGVIGLGHRGLPQLKLLAAMADVNIAAVCDFYEDRLQTAVDVLQQEFNTRATPYRTAEDLLAHPGLDAVMIFTAWESHIDLAIKAMKRGIVPAMEVGGATSLQECWQLVETSEQTGIDCMMLENCCYGREEMALMNMVRQGLFGELVHCRGAYEHDLRDEIGRGDLIRHYRQRHFLNRNAELYPTHELGPIAQYLNLNRGNRMLSLVSVASKAAGLSAWMKEHRQDRPDLANARVNCGDVVTTIITCANGETILLSHDCTLPRAYSRGGRVQGTRGIWMEDGRLMYIEDRTPEDPNYWTHSWESDKPYMEEFDHPLWKEYVTAGVKAGHGGMDYLVLRGFIEALQQGTPLPIDVYDTASWMAVTALSEESITLGGAPVIIPDFTKDRWLETRPGAVGKYALN